MYSIHPYSIAKNPVNYNWWIHKANGKTTTRPLQKVNKRLSQGSDGLIVAQGSGTFHDKGINKTISKIP